MYEIHTIHVFLLFSWDCLIHRHSSLADAVMSRVIIDIQRMYHRHNFSLSVRYQVPTQGLMRNSECYAGREEIGIDSLTCLLVFHESFFFG